MHSYYKQRIFIFKDQDYTQWLTFYVHVRHLKFHFGILVGDMNHFSPIEDIQNIYEVNISLGHTLFLAMSAESHAL